MNEKRFKELLNEYLDGELSGADLLAFKQALSESVRYRNLLRQYQCLQRAQVMACRRKPRLQLGLFPFGQICRSGALLMNTSVLLLCVGLFQTQEPMGASLSVSYSSASAAGAKQSEDAVQVESVNLSKNLSSSGGVRELASSILPMVSVASTGSLLPAVSSNNNGTALPKETVERGSTAAVTPDVDARIISDEYGFVIL